MSDFPEEALPINSIIGSEKILSVRAADGVMIFLTPSQLRTFIGSALATINNQEIILGGNITVGSSETKDSILQKLGVIPIANMPTQKLSTTQFYQATDADDIIINQTWFEAAVQAVGAAQGWSSGGGTPLPMPTAPTVVFNNTNRMFTATHSGYVNGLEKRYNNGSWSDHLDSSTVYGGTDAIAANAFQWRVKAVTGINQAGTIAGNAAIAASGSTALPQQTLSFGTTTDTGIVVNWTASNAATANVLQRLVGSTWTTIYTGANLTFTDTGLTQSTAYQYRIYATASGMTNSPYATGTRSTVAGTVTLAYITSPVDFNNTTFNAATGGTTMNDFHAWERHREHLPYANNGIIQGVSGGLELMLEGNKATGERTGGKDVWIGRNPGNSRITAGVKDDSGVSTTKVLTPYDDSPATSIMRVSLSGTTVLFQYSIDNGVSWIGDQSFTRPNKDLYYRINPYQGQGGGDSITQVKQNGFLIDNTLTAGA